MENYGILYLVGTPIGHLDDISTRAIETLRGVDIIACEDTRRAQKLCYKFKIFTKLTSYFEGNEDKKSDFLINKKLMEGKNVALISDAGLPGISDPGYKLVQKAIEIKIQIVPIPGPTSILTALMVSGLETHRFTFEGFLPVKSTQRKKLLISLLGEERTMIFFETANRIKDTLVNMHSVWGNRQACIARELTKIHEEILRGTLEELSNEIKDKNLKGEIVLLVEGKKENENWENISIHDHVNRLIEEMDIDKKDAIKLVAQLRGLSKRDIYKEVHVRPNIHEGLVE